MGIPEGWKQHNMEDFLTTDQIERVVAIWNEHRTGFAQRVCDEVIAPNIEQINLKLGQENDPKFLAYAVEYVCMQAEARRAH